MTINSSVKKSKYRISWIHGMWLGYVVGSYCHKIILSGTHLLAEIRISENSKRKRLIVEKESLY